MHECEKDLKIVKENKRKYNQRTPITDYKEFLKQFKYGSYICKCDYIIPLDSICLECQYYDNRTKTWNTSHKKNMKDIRRILSVRAITRRPKVHRVHI